MLENQEILSGDKLISCKGSDIEGVEKFCESITNGGLLERFQTFSLAQNHFLWSEKIAQQENSLAKKIKPS